MASQNNFGGLKKVPKRAFAPPVTKSAPPAEWKPLEHLAERRDTQAERIPPASLSHAPRDGAVTKPIKTLKLKDKRQEEHAIGTEKETNKEDWEVAKEEKGCLSDAQLKGSVLQRPLQEGRDFARKAALVQPLKKQSPGRDKLKFSSAANTSVSGKKSGEKSGNMLVEGKQQDNLLKTKKRKKGFVKSKKNEKPEGDNGGRKENRKGAPKKKVQGNTHVIFDQEEIQEQKEADEGNGCSWCVVWVQCSYPNCAKWRRLGSNTDPSVLPEDWSCSQNTDELYNSCDIPEETWSGSENEVVYTVYVPGSVVWAKQYGHPWWPGIVEADPDIGEYFLISSRIDTLPAKYHVTFFGKSVTRAWISASMLRSFGELDVEGSGLAKLKIRGDKKDFETALKMASEAEQMGIQERIKMFGFLNRFSGAKSPRDRRALKEHVGATCKSCVKRIQEPRDESEKNMAGSHKDLGEVLPVKQIMKCSRNSRMQINAKGGTKQKLLEESSLPLSKKNRREAPTPKAATVSKQFGQTRKS